MQGVNSDRMWERLATAVPGKLVESQKHYTIPAQVGKGIKLFTSDMTKGVFTHPLMSGSGNSLIRGHKSETSNSKISFSGNNNILFFGANSRVNNADIRITGSNCVFYFGAFSTVENMTVILSGDGGKIVVGDYCMLSARIIIDRSDHHSIYDLETGAKINDDSDVTISDHVWISRDVRISKGATIGRDSIIGQASLVTGNLEGGNVYGGVPARCLRRGVTWSRMKSGSISEMETSERHKKFIQSVEFIMCRSDLRLEIG